jgi:A/G-specific adenine glycosylase
MTEIPGSDWTGKFDRSAALLQVPINADWRKIPGSVSHVFSHFSLELQVFAAEVSQSKRAPENCWWSSEVDEEALPSVMRKVVDLARG